MTKIVNDIEIVERIYDPYMDLYAVFGRAINAHPEPFVLAWQKRGKKKLHEIERFTDETIAREVFNEASMGETAPEHPIFHKDDQKLDVYAWEDANIHPYSTEIDKNEAYDLLIKVCHDYKIRIPDLVFAENEQDNEYLSETHTIVLKDMDDMTLLHEIAHAIVAVDSENLAREHIAHAPQFVWTLLDLYRDYMDISTQYMVASAQQKNLLGDINSPQLLNTQRTSQEPN